MGENMNLIVAVDKNWGIGYKNKLLVRIPADQRFFRYETTGKAVIMGRKTLESFPGGRPLKNRLNVVLTSDMDYKITGAVVVHNAEEVLKAIEDYKKGDVYVIGGASVYKQMLPFCNVAHVTKIDYKYIADSYFTNLDLSDEWKLTGDSDEQTYFDLIYTFCRYERVI
jgi:dihydrofolate reductase